MCAIGDTDSVSRCQCRFYTERYVIAFFISLLMFMLLMLQLVTSGQRITAKGYITILSPLAAVNGFV